MHTILANCNKRLSKALNEYTEDAIISNFIFNTGRLKDWNSPDRQKCKVLKSLLNQFENISPPYLYWFKIVSNTKIDRIVSEINDLQSSESEQRRSRKLPAFRNKWQESESHFLYVGCCGKTKIADRFLWHFGYSNTAATQGLQLSYWAKPLKMKLCISVLKLPENLSPLLKIYEKELAMELRPIIGKH